MKRTELIRAAVRFVPAVLWMGMIYTFSDQPADLSTEESFGLATQIVEIYAGFSGGMEGPEQLEWSLAIEPILRKAAHMSEYALLAVLLYFARPSTYFLMSAPLPRVKSFPPLKSTPFANFVSSLPLLPRPLPPLVQRVISFLPDQLWLSTKV